MKEKKTGSFILFTISEQRIEQDLQCAVNYLKPKPTF